MSRSTRSGTSSHRLQDKCASVSYVSPCSIVAIIITSQSCALTIGLQVQSFNSDSHLHYTHGARSTLRALAVPGRRVPSRYPTPRREACSRPGLTITRPVFRQESGIRNSRRDSTQEWAMSGQVQELQVPGTPGGGYPGSGTSRYAQGASRSRVVKKIVARTGMGPRNDPFLAPTTHATCGKSSTGSSRMRR